MMSRTKIEIVKCDIKDCGNEKNVVNITMKVVFVTEQTEGRSCKPHLCDETFDICKECLNKVLDGKMIFAYGAQGYNTYYFK